MALSDTKMNVADRVIHVPTGDIISQYAVHIALNKKREIPFNKEKR